MDQRDEWAFDFMLIGFSEGEDEAERLLLKVITPWAEDRNYGVGGGFRRPIKIGDKYHFKFFFGLCATADEQLIPYSHAEELMEMIQKHAAKTGLRVIGECRAYRDDEFSNGD